MTASERPRFTWCRLEDRYLPVYRCMICKAPCAARSALEAHSIVENLLEEGKIKEYFVMTAKKTAGKPADAVENPGEERYFILENGKLKPFAAEDFSSAVIYQALEAFTVERRFVKPEDKQELLYQGKHPAKQTAPMLVMRDGADTVLGSWEDLEANPQQLAQVEEVIAVKPVRQVFVLKRK